MNERELVTRLIAIEKKDAEYKARCAAAHQEHQALLTLEKEIQEESRQLSNALREIGSGVVIGSRVYTAGTRNLVEITPIYVLKEQAE